VKSRLKIFLTFIAPILLIAGFLCTFIKWGNPTGFHGTGFPFASVYWDKANNYSGKSHLPDTVFIDFPNPFAFILNPIAFLIVGLLI